MSDPVPFLTSFAQSLATMALYTEGHPARGRAIDGSFQHLKDLQAADPCPQFSFLGAEVIYRQLAIRELKDWGPGMRLANAGVQRLEFEPQVTREEYELFLDEVLARTSLSVVDSSEARHGRPSSIKFGAIGIRGDGKVLRADEQVLPTATIAYSFGEEADTVRWMHDEVASRGHLPLLEAETVVRALSVAMHGESQIVVPLVQLKEYDQYTTTHSLNVSVLTMALAEFLGLSAREVRTFGVAGLLHDLGKVRVPIEILNKPGKLTDDERTVIQRHPADGARLILESEQKLDLAAVVAYEHHIMIDGGGYPRRHYGRACHRASLLVHVCDVYDALRTNRPYRDAWEAEKTLAYIEERAGMEFEPQIATSFIAMMRNWERRVASITTPTLVPAIGGGESTVESGS
ncbi:MAG TPA: HD domain-containing phosphohydrolase [Gemmatimonadaceae bacterium]|nr:HD domain-containing phosphohydrolase [Gemmatimonadaceae bacterium]